MGGSVLQRPTLVLEPPLAAGARGDGGALAVMLWNQAAYVVDPDDFQLYYLGRLGEADPARRRALHPHGHGSACGCPRS